MAEAPVIEVAEPFTEYSALLDVQMDLYMGLRTASPDQVVGLWEDITGVDQDLIQLAAQPGLVQSALRCGMVLAHEVDILRKDRAAEPATNKAARDTYGHQLGQIAALVLDRGIAEPEITEDPRFLEVQAALGCLAADAAAPLPAAPAQEHQIQDAQTVNYQTALQNLRDHLAAMAPGESYTLSPAQVLTLAAPNMAFSRWQRYRLLRLARQTLTEEGYVCSYNNGRGKHAAYTVGRVAQAQAVAEYSLPIAV